MPVGEVGKNLQAILACESLSRRLKDQFTGLKRAIESAKYINIIYFSCLFQFLLFIYLF